MTENIANFHVSFSKVANQNQLFLMAKMSQNDCEITEQMLNSSNTLRHICYKALIHRKSRNFASATTQANIFTFYLQPISSKEINPACGLAALQMAANRVSNKVEPSYFSFQSNIFRHDLWKKHLDLCFTKESTN